MRISDWSSDVCSSDLDRLTFKFLARIGFNSLGDDGLLGAVVKALEAEGFTLRGIEEFVHDLLAAEGCFGRVQPDAADWRDIRRGIDVVRAMRSEEHTSELQSLMRISYAVFCLKKKTLNNTRTSTGHRASQYLPHKITHDTHYISTE